MTAQIQDSVSANLTLTYVVRLNSYAKVIPFSFNTDKYNYGPDVYFLSNQMFGNTGDDGGNLFLNSVGPLPGSSHIITVKNDQVHNQADLYVDGVYVGRASYRDTTINTFIQPRFFIGNWVSGNYFINGYFAELIIYNKLIDDTERTRLESYLKAKWSIPWLNSSIV